MFKLYEPVFTAAVEELGKLNKQLQLEKENQQTIMNTMSQAWVGKTQQDFDHICKDMVTTGLYQQTAEAIDKIYQIQNGILPKMTAQMARCEKMGEQLLTDSYTAPYLSGVGYYNDGNLELDEDAVPGFNQAVDEAVTQAEEGKSVLENAMNACGGQIDFSSERETLSAGFGQVKRIRNFQTEFNLYVTGVKEIEEELTISLRNVMASDPDPYNQRWNAILNNLNTKGGNFYTLQMLNAVKATAGVSSYLDNMSIFTVSPELQELVVVNEDGTFAFEELLQKDLAELTEKELEMLQMLYQELCTSIEQAEPDDACLLQKNMLEHFLENLYQIEPVYEYSYYGGKHIDGYKVVSKDELIASLISVAAGEEIASMADKMLYSIYETETTADKSWYSGWFLSGMTEEIQSQRIVDVNLELTEAGCIAKVVYCPDASKREKHADEGIMEHYVTSETRISNYVESLSPSEYSHLSSLGYDKEQLKDMMGMTQNRDDFQLVEYLMAGNEKDVFTIAPESFSDGGKNILAAYAINVGIKDIDSGNGLQNLQNFTNHMLGAENWKEKEYMEIMSVYCGLQREAVATAMWNSEGLDLTLVDKMEKVDAITGFYQSLYITGYDMQLDYAMLTYQKLHILVEDLQLDEYGAINYTVVGYNQEPTEGSLRDNIVSETHWNPLQANSDLFSKEMKEINEQIQNLWKSCAVDLVIKSSGLLDENFEKVLELSKAMYEDSVKDGASATTGLKAGEKEFSKGVVYASDVFGILADYYQKKEQLEADYEQAGVNSMVSWFYSSNAYIENGSMDVYNTGIYNPYTIEAIKEWNESGLASFCPSIDVKNDLGNIFFEDIGNIAVINKNGLKQTTDLAEYSDEEIMDAMVLILYGKNGMELENGKYISSIDNVTDIEPGLFSICISEINRKITFSSADSSLEDLWNVKRNSYNGEENIDDK